MTPSFATSNPEMAVSSRAASSGKPEIGLADALGSSVVNVGLILGLALLFSALAAHSDELGRDFVLALVVPILTLILALEGSLSRAHGVLRLALFALWLALVARRALTQRRQATADTGSPVSPWLAWLFLLAGFAALILAGRPFVTGASGVFVTVAAPLAF